MKNKLRAFNKQHIIILKCLLLHNKPMSAYEIAEDKKYGFDNRTRSGEIKKYCSYLFESGILLYSHEERKYKIDWKCPVLAELKKLGQVATRRTNQWIATFLEEAMPKIKWINGKPEIDMTMTEFREYYKKISSIERRKNISPKKVESLMKHTGGLIENFSK